MSDADRQEQLRKLFATECEEMLRAMEDGLVRLESDPTDDETVHGVFRAAHTLKGSAGMSGADAVGAFAHVLEEVLDLLRSKALVASGGVVSDLLASVDVLRGRVSSFVDGAPFLADDEEARLKAKLKAYLAPAAPPEPAQAPPAKPQGSPTSHVYEITLALREDILSTGQDPALLIQELSTLGEVMSIEADTSKLPLLGELDPAKVYLSWRMLLRTEHPREDVDAVFLFVAGENPIVVRDVTAVTGTVDKAAADKKLGELLVEGGAAKPADVAEAVASQRRLGELLVETGKVQRAELDRALQRQQAAREAIRTSSIRVDTEKLDRLVNLVGELVIAVSQVHRQVREAKGASGSVEGLEQISRELQDEVMGLRMVPVRDTFERFRRLVRDTAQELGRYVQLDMSGVETELDKNVLDQLADPLKHMVRNCIAHGIETPAERIAAGKSDTGRVHLKASQREGHIVIEVSDDGRGIDDEKVEAKARARGLVPPGKVLSEREVRDLLFLPGFSTAAEVNSVAGRGVGLDVVRQSVESLRGSVEIESAIGKGTTFRVRLPLTLAIIDGMNVRVGGETVTIPLLSVVELIEPRPGVVKTVEGRGEVVDVRGEILPVMRLGGVFGLEVAPIGRDTMIVVVENEGRKFGVVVDRVLGMEQAVVKPLDRSFALAASMQAGTRKPQGLAGATILGDGKVGLILDLAGVERAAFGAAA